MLTKKQKRINWILVAVLLVLSIFFLFPVIWMLANSFKPDAAITADMNSIAAFIPPALNGNFFEIHGEYAPLCGNPDRPEHCGKRSCRICARQD